MRDTRTGLDVDGADELLERSGALDTLAREVEAVAATGGGRAVFVSGEAGIGKTTLLRAVRTLHAPALRFFWGACDSLFTPRPLGPLSDVGEQAGGELREVMREGGKPYDIADALLRELARRPTVLVLEDLHWGDEASLDVVRILGRRVEMAPVLMLASYRDDDLVPDHPFRTVVGELARERSVMRLRLDRLSESAVAHMAKAHAVDAGELYRTTGGNPFFVTEALAAGDERIPSTVRDAVLARVNRLTPSARSLLEAVATSSQPTELWLLETLAPGDIDALDECLTSGMLTDDGEMVAFRHELARLAIEESIAPRRRRALHRVALAALADHAGAEHDLARFAHHADAAGDADTVQRFAPVAGDRAAAVGAHREAAAQFERALRYADDLPAGRRAHLLDRAAQECELVGRATDAIALRRSAVEIHRAEGATIRQGDALLGLVRPLWLTGQRAEAEVAGSEAVAVLEQCEHGSELARAYAAMSFLHMTGSDMERAFSWGNRALELAEKLGDSRPAAAALVHMGLIEFVRGGEPGRDKLLRALELAQEGRFVHEAGTAWAGLALGASVRREFEAAYGYIEAGIEHCTRYDLEETRPYLVMVRAECELKQGEWQRAADSAALVLREDGVGPATVRSLTVLGRLRARRGDSGQWEVLDRAAELAARSAEILRLGPVAIARAEAAWLEGKTDVAFEETRAAWDLAVAFEDRWMIGELALWRRLAGSDEDPPDNVAAPYARALEGDWQGASRLWAEFDCPYEAALADAQGDDDDCRRALDALHQLGATATAKVVAHQMRERGARGLPRGPLPRTSRNPAGLTAREVEVLDLVAGGLRNAEIAARLFVSVRTVDHHVSAILRKLGVDSRGQVAEAAARLGLGAQR
ncbi:MAG: ATP-binding protein [Actinomycetota bacterium]